MDTSPVIALPSDEELQSAVESEITYKNFQKKPNTKMRVIETPKEELKYREKKSDVLEKEQLSCTTCGKDLKTFLRQKKFSCILPHPVLGVLLCKSCADFYGEGEFSVDEDGTDKYCRWCGQGGTLYLCAECNFGFCRACIKRNLQRSVLNDVEDDNWKCFACKPYPLWDLRSSCAAALTFVEEKKKSRRKLETRPLTTKSRKSKALNSESEDEQAKKKGDVQKKKRSRDSSSDTLEKRKRKRNDSDTGESQEEEEEEKKKKKKKKKMNSSATLKDKKCLYDKEVDRKTTLDTKAAETIASECKKQIDYFLKFLRAMSTEVKNVFREELAIENLLEYAGRKRLLKKMMMLEEMSCQSITQVCENFIVGYRKSFASSIENFEDLSSSELESASRMAQGENKPNEKTEEQEHDDKLIESKKKSTNPSVHKFSESDYSDEQICKNGINKSEKNDSEPENCEKKLKSDSCDETILEKNKSDSDDSQKVSESAKNDAKKYKKNELTENHSKSRKVTVKEHDSQEPETDCDALPHILQSEDACENEQSEKENENGSVSDSDIVDAKEKEEQTTSSKSDVNINSSSNEDNENQENILMTVDKTSVDLSEEEATRSNGKESKINDLECENEENAEDIQVSDFELKIQKQKSKRKSAQDSTEENSGSDNDSLILKKQSEQKSDNSDASTKIVSSKEISDSEDETHVLGEKNLTKNNPTLTEKEENKVSVTNDIDSDEDVISDSGSEKQHKVNKTLDARSPQDSSSKSSTRNNILSTNDGDNLVLSEKKEMSGEKNSLYSCNLKNGKDIACSDGESDVKKSTLSSYEGASNDSDDTVIYSDTQIQSKGATPSTNQDALSDTDSNEGNVVSGEQIQSDEESSRTDLKDGTETNNDAEAVNGADQNEDSASVKEKKLRNKTKGNEGHSKDEEKKAMLALLASSSSEEDHISFRKSRKTLPGEKVKEKCGPLSSKSFEYQEAHKNDQSGVFSDASEEMEVDSDNKICCESDGINSEKLQKCRVVVHRLPEETFQKYKDSFSSSKNNQEKDSEKEIKKLVNLKTLDVIANKKIPTVDSESESEEDANVKKKKVFRKHAKKNDQKKEKEKETLKDFHDKDELSSQSNHSDDSYDNENKKGGLKSFLEELNKNRDKLAQQLLLRSSDSDSDVIVPTINKEKEKKKKESKEKEEVKVKEENEDKGKSCPKKKENETSDESEDIKQRKKWRSDKLLRMKLSETDTSEEERKWELKKAKEAKEKDEKGSESEGPHAIKKKRKKTGAQRRLINSDSEVLTISSDSSDSDSDRIFKPNAKRKHKGNSESDKSKKSSASESDQSIKKKTKRRRIRKPVSDSSNSDSDDGGIQNSQKSDTTPSKGRKNIRKVMKDDNVADATRQAAKDEEERRKRIAEKQKLYNALYNLAEARVETIDKLVLDFDTETKKELIQVDSTLVKKLKPHQVKGVKFMWDACFESLEMIKKSEGTGCILAHCMGLGKTLQVITLVHTLLNNPKTTIKTVLVVCPLSTVLNWVNEFSKWLDECEDNDIEVLDITRYKQMYERLGVLKHWHSNGGVLILSYPSYRTLTNPKIKRQRKKCIDTLQSTLVDPGPDLVICDEGHQLKNEESALSKAMSRLRTKRRIVLTGTPLQNNLLEYHCMVQFVKPNLLGTKKEFKNRFINPINNGQYDNSTAHDVKVMKRRAHVLHRMLDSSVQRYDYSVLTPFLPPKFEYVLLVRLTDLQIKLYKYFLENLSFASLEGQKTRTARLFSDFQALQRIWTHPRVLLMNAERREKKQILEESDSEGSLKDFIASSSETSSSDSDIEEISEENSNHNKRKTRSAKTDDNDSESGKSESSAKVSETNEKYGHRGEWWWQFISEESLLDDIKQSGKISLLFTILEECEKIGDKVLIFSQSLLSLDLIEYFLSRIDDASQDDEEPGKQKTSWVLGLDYFRLDGSSNAENRMAWCKIFNQEDNYRARLFLISTRAGGLGINLTAANRVILFDASWNPSYDVQSIFRVYRFGQKKPCYIYRFLAQHTMEEKIYNRQVTKLSLACRVVDEQQIERHYSMDDLQELYNFNPEEKKTKETPLVPKDVLLAELVRGEEPWVDSYHEHDTLLENKEEEELNEEERKAAWDDYEKEKQGPKPSVAMYDNSALVAYLNQFGYSEQYIRDSIIKENPQWSETQIQYHVNRVLKQILDYVAAEEHRKQLQVRFNMNQVQQQPLYFQTPQTQGMVPGVNQARNAMQNQNSGHFINPILSQQNTLQTAQPQPGPSLATDNSHRIKVKSFGHMVNSNFQNRSQLMPNPFASKTGITDSALNQQTVQKPSNKTNTDVIEVE